MWVAGLFPAGFWVPGLWAGDSVGGAAFAGPGWVNASVQVPSVSLTVGVPSIDAAQEMPSVAVVLAQETPPS